MSTQHTSTSMITSSPSTSTSTEKLYSSATQIRVRLVSTTSLPNRTDAGQPSYIHIQTVRWVLAVPQCFSHQTEIQIRLVSAELDRDPAVVQVIFRVNGTTKFS